MGEVFVQGGKAFLIDPHSMAVTAIDQDQLGAALAGGYLPATKDEAISGARQEYYSSTGQQLKTGALSALAGATLGASDVLATKAGLVSPEQLRAGREVNPNLATGANIAGSVVGALVPGGPVALATKGAAKAGAMAGQAAARGLSTTATGLVPKAAEILSREALVGAAIGAGQGVSKVAEDDLSLGDAMAHVATVGGQGALFGAGLGAIGVGLRAGADRYLSKLGGSEKLKALRGEEKVVAAELEAARAAGPSKAGQMQAIEDRLLAVTTASKDYQADILKRVFHKAVGMGIGATLGGGVGYAALGYLIAPRALKTLGSALSPIAGKADDVARRIAQRIAPAVAGAKAMAESVADKSPMAAKIAAGIATAEQKVGELAARGAGAVGQVLSGAKTPMGLNTITAETAGHALGSAAGVILSAMPDKALAGAMIGGVEGALIGLGTHHIKHKTMHRIGGGVEGALIGLGTHHIKHKTMHRIGEVLSTKIARPIKTGLETSILSTDLIGFLGQAEDLDPYTLDALIQAQMPQDMPPQMAQEASKRVATALDVLRGAKAPTAGDKHNMADLRKFNSVAKSITDPESFVEDFGAGRLSRAQVDAWQRVYPEALAQLRGIVRAEMAHAEAKGLKYSRQQNASIETLLGGRKMYDSERVAQIQAMHSQAGRSGSGGPAAPAPVSRGRLIQKVASSRQTQMQRISEGS